MDDNINNIATDIRMLAAEIGGGHHSNKESEKMLLDLAKRLDKVGCDTILLIDRIKRQNAIKEAKNG